MFGLGFVSYWRSGVGFLKSGPRSPYFYPISRFSLGCNELKFVGKSLNIASGYRVTSTSNLNVYESSYFARARSSDTWIQAFRPVSTYLLVLLKSSFFSLPPFSTLFFLLLRVKLQKIFTEDAKSQRLEANQF